MTAIPASMRLEPKPEAINAYRRRCVTNATSSNPYPSRGTIKIPLDTAFPGSMLDTSQTQLAFTLAVTNSNPFVDYFNLPKCGVNAFIKEYRVMVNGQSLVKNSRYGLAFEDAMNKMGINSEPYEFFKPNPWCPSTTKFHCNMIKPSMVDALGFPMYRSQLFTDDQQADQLFFGHANTTVAGGIPTTPAQGVRLSGVLNWRAAGTNTEETSINWSQGTQLGRTAGVYCGTVPAGETNTYQLNNFNSLIAPLDSVTLEHQNWNRGNHTLGSPMDWPFNQPGHAPPRENLSARRWQDITTFYANCKNIPIGMYKKWSQQTAYTEANQRNNFNWNTDEFIPTSNKSVTEFRCTTPLLCGMLGLLTDKFFPDMLVAAGKMWIEIDLQPKEVALQLLMDPCRRIPGTMRDFVPYTGRLATVKRCQDPTAANTSILVGPYRCMLYSNNVDPANADQATYYARMVFGEGVCCGEHLGFGLVAAGTSLNSNTVVTEMWDNAASPRVTPIAALSIGHPYPQYCFVASPWTKKDSTVVLDSYLKETQACYGTYLRSAVAQTRRTLNSTNCDEVNQSFVYTSYDTDYTFNNVVLYTEQIIVPDEIASQLLLSARNGAISYHTSNIGATYNNAPLTTSQNLILTVTGASVNSVTFLFQSNAQLSGTEAFAYNSFASYCPWTKLDFSTTVDVGGTYTLTNPLLSTNNLGLNLYLKIGNEMIPRQPINDIPSFLVELQKGFQTLADYNVKLPLNISLVPTTLSNNDTSCMQYNVLEDGFLSCFVEAKALDDQTLTGNPYLGVMGYNAASSAIQPIAARRQGTKRGGSNADITSSATGVLNLFKPLDGNFRMCFNLSTFETQTSARCGTPIVNNQLFLQGDQMNFMTHTVAGQYPSVCVTALYEQDAKVVFEQGGNCLLFM